MKWTLFLCVVWLAFKLRRHFAVKRGAQRIGDRMKVLQQTSSEYEPADPAQFPFLDLEWYELSAAALQDSGFRFIEDKANVGHNQRNPNATTFIRVLFSADGSTLAGLYHYKNRAVRPSSSAALSDARVADFETEMSDGHFIITSNASPRAKFDYGPRIHDQRFPISVPIDLHHVHAQRVAEYIAANSDAAPCALRTAEDGNAMSQRLQRVKGEHRQRMQVPITEAELKRFDDGRYPDTAAQLARAIEKSAPKQRS